MQDLTCCDCGKVMRRRAGSLPQGEAKCHACRRLAREAEEAAREARSHLRCERCGVAFTHPPGLRRKFCTTCAPPQAKQHTVPCVSCGKLGRGQPGRICHPCRKIKRTRTCPCGAVWVRQAGERGDNCKACRAASRKDVRCVECGDVWRWPTAPGVPPKLCPLCRFRLCAWCGESFSRPRPSYMHQDVCSRSCAARRLAGWSRSLEIVHVEPVPKPRQVHPSDLPPPKRSDWWQLLISGPCRRCGEDFTALAASFDTAAVYCSDRCSKADAKARRRARKRGAYVENVYRKKIFERDGWRCQICRKTVARTKVAPHPRAPTLDHIIPLAQGGTHEPSNCQLACFRCNCLKGDRIGGVGDQLRLIG